MCFDNFHLSPNLSNSFTGNVKIKSHMLILIQCLYNIALITPVEFALLYQWSNQYLNEKTRMCSFHIRTVLCCCISVILYSMCVCFKKVFSFIVVVFISYINFPQGKPCACIIIEVIPRVIKKYNALGAIGSRLRGVWTKNKVINILVYFFVSFKVPYSKNCFKVEHSLI